MDKNLEEKLRKLYVLSKQGIDGEKDNAGLLLNRLLAKHGISISDIENESKKHRTYKYTTRLTNDLISQIVFSVVNHINVYESPTHKCISVDATDYEHVQILELIDFHLSNFDKERKEFLQNFKYAYIQKHRLYRDTSNEDNDEEEKPLTHKEKLELWKISNIQNCLSNKTYTKKLE